MQFLKNFYSRFAVECSLNVNFHNFQSKIIEQPMKNVSEIGVVVNKKFIATHAHGIFKYLKIDREFQVCYRGISVS